MQRREDVIFDIDGKVRKEVAKARRLDIIGADHMTQNRGSHSGKFRTPGIGQRREAEVGIYLGQLVATSVLMRKSLSDTLRYMVEIDS
jgi:hypothetical protein